MKKKLLILISAVLSVVIVCTVALVFILGKEKNKGKDEQIPVWDIEKPIKILAIGNSFTQDSFTYMWEIMEALSFKEVYLAYLYIGGSDIDIHYKNITNTNTDSSSSTYVLFENYSGIWKNSSNYKVMDALTGEMWDFVVIQQRSGYSGLAETYSNLNAFVDVIKENSPTSKIVWCQTWAYQQDTNHGDFLVYQSDQIYMFNQICKVVKDVVAVNEKIDIIVPAGTAIQNARTSSLGDTLTRDGYHLSETGRYIAGLSYVHKITGASITNIEYAPSFMDEEVKQICIKSAENACLNRAEITAFS